MAISASTVWEIRTTGNNTNGGGYVSGGTDYSQQDTPQLSVSDGASSSTTNLNSATGGFTSAMVGNVLQISGGTLTAGFYEIVAYVDTNNVTLDRALNTGSGSTVNVGGALADVDTADNAIVAGNVCYIKSGTYTRTASWAATVTGTTYLPIVFVGYDTTRSVYNTDSIKPLITTSTTATPLINGNNFNFIQFRNISWSNTATGANKSSLGTNATTASLVEMFNCIFDGFTSLNPSAVSSAARFDTNLYWCEVKNCTGYGLQAGTAGASLTAYYTYFHDNLGGMLHPTTSGGALIRAYFCIFDSNTEYDISLTRTTTSQPNIDARNCVFYNAVRGINLGGNAGVVPDSVLLVNNIFYGGTYGIYQANVGSSRKSLYNTNAFGGQSTSARLNFDTGANEITLSANPFVDAAAGNFSLNSTAGGGALLRGLGFPLIYMGSATNNYPDVGATQHQDSSSNASTGAPICQKNLPEIRVF